MPSRFLLRSLLAGSLLLAPALLPLAHAPAPVRAAEPALAPSLQGRPVVVDIYASWCPGCRAIEPTLLRLRRELSGDAHFIRFDVSDAGRLRQARQEAGELGLASFLEKHRSQTALVAVIDPSTGRTVRTFRASADEAGYRQAIRQTRTLLQRR